MSQEIRTLSREQVQKVCPIGADKMKLARIKSLSFTDDGLPADDSTVKLFSVLRQDAKDSLVSSALSANYVIKHEGSEWVLYDHSGDKVLGKHKTEAEALAQERAIQVSKNHAVSGLKAMDRVEVFKKCPECAGKMAATSQDMPVDAGGHMQHICGKGGRAVATMANDLEVHEYANAIKGVEIFKTGTHNGDVYTEKDLDDMVEAFGVLDYRPAIKIGHSKDTPGAPAYGWVQNVTRDGDKLRADFTDMHDSVVEAIRNKNYDRCSSEIYFNLKRGGKDYRRALKAVALLGAEVPAVAGLTPLHKMEFAAEGFERVGTLEQALEVPSQALLESLAERVSGLITLIKEHAMNGKMMSRKDMLAKMKKENPDASEDEITTMVDEAMDEQAGEKEMAMKKEVKELKAKVEEFNQKMEELKKTKSGLTDEELAADAEYKALSEQADAIADKITELENAGNDDTESIAELREKLKAAEAKAEESQQQTKELSERVAKIERDKVNLQIGERVKACKIPAFRPALEAMYAYALTNTEATVKVYSKKDGKDVTEEKTLAEVTDGMVSEINAQSEKLFKALAFTGAKVREDGETEEDAGKDVQKRVTEYRAKHPEVKTYEEAMTAVLGSDEALAARYRSQLGREQ